MRVRIKITDIHPEDQYFEIKESFIGKTGGIKVFMEHKDNFRSGSFISDNMHIEEIGGSHAFFYKVKYEVLDEKIK